MFKQPFYVSPHAVKRFRQRVADLPTRTIRTIIQAQLQGCRDLVTIQVYNRQRCPVYLGRYLDKKFLIPVLYDRYLEDKAEELTKLLAAGGK